MQFALVVMIAIYEYTRKLYFFLRRRRRNKSEGAAHSEGDRADPHSSSFEIDSEMDFPTLGSSCDSKVMSRSYDIFPISHRVITVCLFYS